MKDEVSNSMIVEWNSISKYLVGEIPTEDKFIIIFLNANQNLDFSSSQKEIKIFNKAINNPWLLPHLDAALALGQNNSLLRKKILLVFSILETSKEYHAEFSTVPRSRFYWLKIIFFGIRAVSRLIIGKIILLIL
jgi:hypothetical protein